MNLEIPEEGGSIALSFQGNEVKNQDWHVALFQDIATALATLEASRIATCYACFPDHDIESRDVEQAYISAILGGPTTYASYPKNSGHQICIQ